MTPPNSEKLLLEGLRGLFHSAYAGSDPEIRVRAPGRINLIGEHIDYNGLPVLPMAIQQAIWVEARPRDDASVCVVNLDRDYPPHQFTLSASIAAASSGAWINYVQAAAQALVEDHGALRGCEIAVGSTLPAAAGLSSSSALVIATTLALLTVNELTFEPLVLAERMAHAERYVGTEGGGMDQTVCLAARAGTASRIEFDPLRVTPLPIPDDWVFVVAHSGTTAEKSGAAQATYNRRTEECAGALAAIARHLGLPAEEHSYRGLMVGNSVEDLLEIAKPALAAELERRFRHVITEAGRVEAAERALWAGDSETFGQLLSASHASLRDDYEVSTPELDRICTVAEESGACGARLTGAGLGGCAIALCQSSSAEAVLEALVADSSSARPFVARASEGATIARL